MVTLPPTSLVRMPTLLSPVTVILPVVLSDPARVLSMAMPPELLPSTRIVPELTMSPV